MGVRSVARSLGNRFGLVSAAGLVAGVLTISTGGVAARADDQGASLWEPVAVPAARGVDAPAVDIDTTHALAFSLNAPGMNAELASAPLELTPAAKAKPEILSLPKPDGGFEQFAIQLSPVMAPELAAKYPDITSYSGQGIDDPAATVRLDQGPKGFHAQVLSPSGDWYIDPYYHADLSVYVSYFRTDLVNSHGTFVDGALPDGLTPTVTAPAATAARSTGTQLHTYRLAVAADGEYSQFQAMGGTPPTPTTATTLAAIVTAVNRVTGIYELELDARLQLIANETSIIYLDPSTDPYNNTNANSAITQNQHNIDNVIGNANYDVGHVFTTGAGGLADLGVIGQTGFKAMGVTGTSSPTGDAYWVDYVAHELGHEFGGDHTFQGVQGSCGGNGNPSTDVEPGSGTTIMAYAGICGTDDLQNRAPGSSSDPYFSAKSYEQIEAVMDGFPGAVSNTGNSIPTVTSVGGTSFVVPVRTPFALTASGTDANSDSLTYAWEQYDTGALRALDAASKPDGALFRSQVPSTSGTRYFPKLASIAAGTTDASTGNCPALPGGLDCFSEYLPTTARTLHFRATVRDNRLNGGGVNSADATVTVAGSAPFRVTSPNTATTFASGSTQTVTWDVAGTTAAPFNTANVDICMSSDGGATFPTLLAGAVPNTGTASVTLPNTSTTHARFVVKASGGIFFDMSDADLTLSGGSGSLPAASASCSPAASGSGGGGGGGGGGTTTASFVPLVPARLLDSRQGFATADGVSAGIGVRDAGTVTAVTVAGRGGVAGDASAVVLNVTVTGAQGIGFVTVFPCGSPQPNASNLNYVVGQTIPNAVISKVGDSGQVCIYNKDPLDLIVDVTGYFPAAG
ncbi:MAG: hypothetical protein JWM34_2741 [Ilumatobacteraceae bacterium]|nr:hypothetical protein [Ilumatobacteraceae bacterium]